MKILSLRTVLLIITITVLSHSGASATPSAADGEINGYTYVDLGLPSGTLWATLNLGASAPQEYGNFYQGGKTEPSTSFKRGTGAEICNSFTNICGNPQYDPARKHLGSPWRLPSLDDLDELIYNTTPNWETVEGVKGLTLTSKLNGKSIFFPAGGWGDKDTFLERGYNGYFLTGTMMGDPVTLYINSTKARTDVMNAFLGCAVRPVARP